MVLNLRPTPVKITGSMLLLKAWGKEELYTFGLKPLIGLRFIHVLREPVWGTIASGKLGNYWYKERAYQTWRILWNRIDIFEHSWSLLLLLRYFLLTPWSRALLEKITSSQLVKKFPAFYGTRRLQIPATCSYPEPDQSSPYTHVTPPEDQS